MSRNSPIWSRQRTTLPPSNIKEKSLTSSPYYSLSGTFSLRPNSVPRSSAVHDIFEILPDHQLQGLHPLNLPFHPYPTWTCAHSSPCTMSALSLPLLPQSKANSRSVSTRLSC